MTDYYTKYSRVTFNKSFVLKGLIGLQPPGTYSIETRDENGSNFLNLKGVKNSTWIRTCQNFGLHGKIRFNRIDPTDLSKALADDIQNFLA